MVRVCVDVKIEPVKVACVVECVFIIKSLFGNFLAINSFVFLVLEKNLISSLVISKLREGEREMDGGLVTKSLLFYNEY